ncbi:TPA: glycoside hydrolase family 68 protein, partial [Burkholderia cenocepacia]
GLVLGNPTDFSAPAGAPYAQDPNQNPREFQSYSHYVMPGGLVESFIDAIGPRRGGTLAPTVKVNINGTSTAVDRAYGRAGLGGYGDIPANLPATGAGHN